MAKPDRLALALNGPREQLHISHGLDSRLTFKKLRRPTPLPNAGQPGASVRCMQWVFGDR